MTKTKTKHGWDNHSTPVDGKLTVREALAVAACDWDAVLITQSTTPKYDEDESKREPADFEGIVNPECRMVVQTDTKRYLGTVGRRYTVVQNRDAFSFFDNALGQNAACIEAVGRLGEFGGRVFMIAALPDMLEILPGEPLHQYIMLTTTHDGSGNIEAMFLHEQDGVCVQPTSESEGRVRIRHTKNAEHHLKQAHTVLAKSADYWERAQRAYRYMAKRDVDSIRLRALLNELFPAKQDEDGKEKITHQTEKKRAEIAALFESAPQNEWGFYNTVARFVQDKRPTANKKKVGRWEIAVLGAGANLRRRIFKILTRDLGDA